MVESTTRMPVDRIGPIIRWDKKPDGWNSPEVILCTKVSEISGGDDFSCVSSCDNISRRILSVINVLIFCLQLEGLSVEYHYDSTKDLDEDYKAALKSSQYVISGCHVEIQPMDPETLAACRRRLSSGSDRPTKRKSTTPISGDSCSETYLDDLESTGNQYFE